MRKKGSIVLTTASEILHRRYWSFCHGLNMQIAKEYLLLGTVFDITDSLFGRGSIGTGLGARRFLVGTMLNLSSLN